LTRRCAGRQGGRGGRAQPWHSGALRLTEPRSARCFCIAQSPTVHPDV